MRLSGLGFWNYNSNSSNASALVRSPARTGSGQSVRRSFSVELEPEGGVPVTGWEGG